MKLLSSLIQHVMSLVLPSLCEFTSCFDHNVNLNAQAPVSDREYKATLPETAAMIDLASSMIKEGRESELMPREADPCSPITAQRWLYFCILAVVEHSTFSLFFISLVSSILVL